MLKILIINFLFFMLNFSSCFVTLYMNFFRFSLKYFRNYQKAFCGMFTSILKALMKQIAFDVLI